MNKEEIKKTLVGIFSDCVLENEISFESHDHVKDHMLDSLDYISAIMSVEKTFGINISDADSTELANHSFGYMAEYIDKLLNAE